MKPVAHYEKILRDRLAELESRLHKIETDLEATPNPDFEERATERGNDEVLEEIGQTGLQEIRMIRAALDRIEKDEFGVCARCGEDIPEARLDLVPHAAVCNRPSCQAGRA